jgi:hypothetical protein
MKVQKLRSTPVNVLYDDARSLFNLTSRWNPKFFIKNEYEVVGNTIIDRATGLHWQRSGSELLSLYEIDSYIKKLNDEKFAGYDGWRLPTTEELLSLMEPEKQENDLYISSMFDPKQHMCWGADSHKGYRWNIYFQRKRVFYDIKVSHFIRAVRDLNSGDAQGTDRGRPTHLQFAE